MVSAAAQLLGREYYQTSVGEKYLVFTPLAVHSLSGIAKRLLWSTSRNSGNIPGKAPVPRRPILSLLSWTGYATAFLFLPIHFITHRLNPSSPDNPISSVGPSELDYEFVKLGLQTWPVRSWVLYVGLVGLVALHVADGTKVIWNSWLRNTVIGSSLRDSGTRSGNKLNWCRKYVMMGSLVLPVVTGLYAISREPPMIFSSMATRFEAAFAKSLLYRI